MSDRECGDCKLCCKLLSIDEIDKPQNEWCPDCEVKGLLGCRIYDDRPKACDTFSCYWLKGHIPEEFKPNKIKAVIWWQEKSDLGPLMMIAESIHDQHRTNRHLRAFVEHVLDRGQMIVILHPNNSRSILGNSEHHADVNNQITEQLDAKGVDYRLETF